MSALAKWWPFAFKRGEKKVPVTVNPSTAPRPHAPGLPSSVDPFQHFDELFARMRQDPFAALSLPSDFFGDFSAAQFTPAVDITDEGKYLRISAEVPGVDPDDLELTVEDGVLTIRGEKRHESESKEKGVYRVERSYGSFRRTLPLPPGVDENGAEASFAKGVLTIRFPKTEATEAAPRRIPIST